jgi:Kef-type K+ transport system membrane component KefB
MVATAEQAILRAIVDVSLLIFMAKILAGVFSHLQLPEVLGEVLAGIVLSPHLLGGIRIAGNPIIELNVHVVAFAEIGAILLLFVAGLEVEFAQFRALGGPSFAVGALGVVVPFVMGAYAYTLLGNPGPAVLIVGAALTATSIAVTMRTLDEMGRLNTTEGNLMINSAVIDDVLGLILLSVVVSVLETGLFPSLTEVAQSLLETVGIWLVLVLIVVFIGPRLVRAAQTVRASGTVEVAATALCFGSAAGAAALGLHPIVGAFAAGMAIAGSRVLGQVKEYIDKINLIFSPIFFAFIGAQLDLFSLREEALLGILILIAIAIVSKIVGCGLPAYAYLRNKGQATRVGIGMVSRGEVGLIIAGIGLTSGSIGQNVYAQIVTMAIATTIITPVLLRRVFRGVRNGDHRDRRITEWIEEKRISSSSASRK